MEATQIKNILNTFHTISTQARLEYKSRPRMTKVARIDILEKLINTTTKAIWLEDGKIRIILNGGKYRIRFSNEYFKRGSYYVPDIFVRIEDLKVYMEPTEVGYRHPHILSKKEICYGQFKSPYWYIFRNDLFGLIFMLSRFIVSINPSNILHDESDADFSANRIRRNKNGK